MLKYFEYKISARTVEAARNTKPIYLSGEAINNRTKRSIIRTVARVDKNLESQLCLVWKIRLVEVSVFR